MPAPPPLTPGQPDPVMLFDIALGPGATPSSQAEVTGLAVDDRAAYLLGPVVGESTQLAVVDKLGQATTAGQLSIAGRWTEISVLPGPDRSLLALLGSGQLGIHDPVSGRVTTVFLPAQARGLAADIDRRLFYVGLEAEIAIVDPDAGRRLCGIALPGGPTQLGPPEQLLCAENGTLVALLGGAEGAAVAIVEPNASQAEVIELQNGPRSLCYDDRSGLVFLAVDATAIEPAGVAVIDRDSGRRIGGVIQTSLSPASLTLLRCGPRTHLYASVPGAGLEVIDVARRAVVGRLCAVWVGAFAAADQAAGELYIADRFAGARRILPLIGGSPIARHVTRNSSTEQITPPLSGPRTTPDGSTEMQKFDIGTVVASTDAGAVIVDPTHAELWLSSDGPAPGPASAADQLGNPVGDTIAEDDHLVTYFERGLMVTTPVTGGPTTVAVPRFEASFNIGALGVADELEFLLGREQ
ncbi:MAG: hypothetical protein ABWZ02_02055 [Nakamurella sp.]